MANDNSVVVKVGDKVFIKGDQGAVFIPAVDEQGNISWTNDGGLPNPTTRNIMGPEGEKGDTPNFSIGTVTTGDPGSPAAASITGTPDNPVLNLTIPKGNTGEVTQAEFDELADEVADQKSAFNDMVEDTMDVTPTGSYYDFSEYIGKPLFGTNGMFSGAWASFDIDISGLDLSGKTISTFIWIDALSSYIEGNITEVQLDENGAQIYPTSGYHYVGHAMTILPECKKIRLRATLNSYNSWSTAIITHAQLYDNGNTEVNYNVNYSVHGMVAQSDLNDVKTSVDFAYIVTSNNQFDPSGAIGKTFGEVNDSIYKFPFGKTLADIGNGHTNFIVHLNSGSISGYFQLIKEDGTTDNGNYSFNTSTISIIALLNIDLIRGVKIHAYSAATGTVITSFGMTFNGASLDTFATGVKSNVNPASWAGKKWVSYGDSITQGRYWQPYVIKRTGLELTNAGLGSSCVADVDDATVASFTNVDRIAALPADADVVTIMGGTNDYGHNIPLGSIPTSDPYDKTTFIGALCETVRLIQTKCPNALLIIMSNVGGRGTAGQARTIPPRNTIGLASSDYALAAEQVADFLGVPFIDVHRCGITPMNRVLYMTDSVHPNVEGAKLIARKVIDYLTNNYPI